MKYKPKTKPFQWQGKCIKESWDREYYGILAEPGTGKTKVITDNAGMLYTEGEIDGLVVTAPNGVQRGWVIDQFPRHFPDSIPTLSAYYRGADAPKYWRDQIEKMLDKRNKGFRLFTFNFESAPSPDLLALLKRMFKSMRLMWCIDEAHRIKNHKAKSSEKILNLSDMAPYRRILTGTPVPNSPMDVYAPFLFLDKSILNQSSFATFKAYYAELAEDNDYVLKHVKARLEAKYGVERAKHMMPKLVARDADGKRRYKNLDQLRDLIAPHSTRVLKKDCLDLPTKMYVRRHCELNREQRKIYNQLRELYIAEMDGTFMTATLAIVRMTRLMQVTGGFFAPEDGAKVLPIGKTNPKMDTLLEIVDGYEEGKFLIWARFTEELRLIADKLREVYGDDSVSCYWGEFSNKQKDEAKRAFIERPTRRFFVAQPKSGGTGLDGLQIAQAEIYYSNEFSLIDRIQSEDRGHRSGMGGSLTIYDIEAVNTLDHRVIDCLIEKKEIADMITGDPPQNWI